MNIFTSLKYEVYLVSYLSGENMNKLLQIYTVYQLFLNNRIKSWVLIHDLYLFIK